MTAKQDEKNQKIIRQLLTLPENKKCADCTAKGPVYANTTFHTFVCTACSGIHREFNHRVKSISMASFKPEEIKALQDGGNKVANDTYLARWNPDDFREPDPADVDKLRQWIKLKYIEKRWIAGGSNPTSPSKGAQRQPNQGQTQQASARQPAQQTSQPNLFQQQPQQQQAKPQQNMVLDTSLFAAQPTQQPQQASTPFDPFGHNAQPQQQQQGHELSGVMFPSQEQQQAFQQQQQQQQQHQQQQKKTTDLLSQLGNMYQQSAMQQQQMAMLQQQQLYQQMMQQQQQPQPQGQPNPFGQNPQFAQQNPQFAQPNPFGQNPQFAQQNPQFAQNPQMAQNAQFAAFGMAPQQQAQPNGQFPFGAQPVAQPQGNPFGMPIAQQAPAQHGGWGAPQQHVELDSYGLPVGQNPYLQAQSSAPVHQEPPKADPFASLTSLASNIKAKPKQTSTPSPSPAMTPAPVPVSSQPAQQEDDIFGGFSSPVATQSAPQHENPFGFTEAPQQQQAPADFNPFF